MSSVNIYKHHSNHHLDENVDGESSPEAVLSPVIILTAPQVAAVRLPSV